MRLNLIPENPSKVVSSSYLRCVLTTLVVERT